MEAGITSKLATTFAIRLSSLTQLQIAPTLVCRSKAPTKCFWLQQPMMNVQ